MLRIKYIVSLILISIITLNAQINNIQLTKTDQRIQIDAGTRIKITTNDDVKLKGKISYFINDTVLYLIAGKDTVNANDVKEIRVFYKGTRIAGDIIAVAGAASSLFGIAMVIAASTELGNPGNWAGLGMVIGGMYTAASATVGGLGLLVKSIGKTYKLDQWTIVYEP